MPKRLSLPPRTPARARPLRRVPAPVPDPPQPSVPGSLRSEFAAFKKHAATSRPQFKGRAKRHIDKILTFRGHQQFMKHGASQPKGGGFGEVVGKLWDLAGSAYGVLQRGYDALNERLITPEGTREVSAVVG